jgi:hypothetical protein
MTDPTVEVHLDESERLKFTQSPRNGVAAYAVFGLNGVVALVEGLACSAERINLGQQSTLDKGEPFVQPYLGGNPYPSKFSFHAQGYVWMTYHRFFQGSHVLTPW